MSGWKYTVFSRQKEKNIAEFDTRAEAEGFMRQAIIMMIDDPMKRGSIGRAKNKVLADLEIRETCRPAIPSAWDIK